MLKGKILKISSRALILVLMILFIFCSYFMVFAVENKIINNSEHISMGISYGYGNIAKGGRYLPIHVFYENFSNENFEGKISFEFIEEDKRKYSYRYEVKVEEQGVLLSNYNIKISNGVNVINAILKDKNGNTVVEKLVHLDIGANRSKIMTGVLSDTGNKLDYFNDVSINYGLLNLNLVNLAAVSFPSSYSGLEQLDIIIISNYRIRELSNEQSRALMDWVKQGGVLIMGTGARADDTIGRYAPELLEDTYDPPSINKLTFEFNNESKSTELESVYLNLHGGNVLLYDNEFPLITSVNKEKGIIAVAAFDFCDLSELAQENTQFARYIISVVLGNERIEAFLKQNGDPDNTFQNIEPILNASETKKLPPMTVYTLFIFTYIILIGPAMYIFLRYKSLAIYYRKCILIFSLFFLIIIIIYNGRTRFASTFYNYVTVYDAGESDVSESTYVNIKNPYNKPYQVVVDSNYTVVPIISDETKENGRKSLSHSAEIGIDNEEYTKNISINQIGAFSSNILRLDKIIENQNKEGFTGDIDLFENELSLNITNNYKYKVKNATLIFYGKIALLGDFDPGETKEIENCPTINIPLTNFDITSKLITGLEMENGESKPYEDVGNYMQEINISNFISFYLKENSNGYTPDARIIAFSETPLNNPIFYSETMESDGLTLLTSVISVNSTDKEKSYRQALLKMPLVLSGSYSYIENALIGNEATVLEYFLGDNIGILEVNFEPVSKIFSNSKYSDIVKIFNGNIALYNFKTGNFDYISGNKIPIVELLPYLSDYNTIRVRYSNIEEGNIGISLPMITVWGVEK